MDQTRTDWITPSQAAVRAQVTPECVARWCLCYGIGRKVAGRWRVDPAALDRLLAGALACGGDDALRAA